MRTPKTGLLVVLALCLLVADRASATTVPANIPNTLRASAATRNAEDLLIRADEVLNSIKLTTYSSLGTWDVTRGIYKLVCARYLTHLLDEALPQHLDAIRAAEGSKYPGVWNYFGYFSEIPYGQTRGGFTRLKKVSELRPGDIITWRNEVSTSTWGHVVVVASVPARDTRFSNAYKIRITDCTSTPHSNDNRPAGNTGVGAGEMLFRADATTGKPSQLAWTLKGYWKSPEETTIVLVRP